jgi:ethanolamine ammonia-lyase large subunit
MAEVIAEALEAGEMAMAVHSIGRMVDMLETAAPAVLGVMHISDPERGIVDIMDEVRSLTDEWHIRIEAKCGLVHIEEELEAGRG